jgi:hypothetical protein
MSESKTEQNVAKRELPARDTYAPEDIATALYGRDGAFQGAKRVRAYLRATYTRDVSQKGKSWILSPEVATHVFDTLASEKVTSVVTEADKRA